MCRFVPSFHKFFLPNRGVCCVFSLSVLFLRHFPFVCSGLGLALNFQPSLIMLNRYFNEKRPLANGLAAAGSPVALCCLSPLGQVLQYQYGWRGGFLILGGLLLNCCACAALMRPLLPPKKSQDLELSDPTAIEEKKPPPKKKLLDFSVFRDRGFVIYTVAASVMVLGLFVPPVFVVNYAKGLGYEDTKSALLLTILGFVDMFARPTCGLIAGMKWVRPRCVYFFGFAIIFNGCTDLVGSQVTLLLHNTMLKPSLCLVSILAGAPCTEAYLQTLSHPPGSISVVSFYQLCSFRYQGNDQYGKLSVITQQQGHHTHPSALVQS